VDPSLPRRRRIESSRSESELTADLELRCKETIVNSAAPLRVEVLKTAAAAANKKEAVNTGILCSTSGDDYRVLRGSVVDGLRASTGRGRKEEAKRRDRSDATSH